MPKRLPQAQRVIDTITLITVREHGGVESHWRTLLGSLHVLSGNHRSESNWALVPGGDPAEQAALAHATELTRILYPRISHRSDGPLPDGYA